MSEHQEFHGTFHNTLNKLSQEVLPQLEQDVKNCRHDFHCCRQSNFFKKNTNRTVRNHREQAAYVKLLRSLPAIRNKYRFNSQILQNLKMLKASLSKIKTDDIKIDKIYTNYKEALDEELKSLYLDYKIYVNTIESDKILGLSNSSVNIKTSNVNSLVPRKIILQILAAQNCYKAFNAFLRAEVNFMPENTGQFLSAYNDECVRNKFIQNLLFLDKNKFPYEYINQIINEFDSYDAKLTLVEPFLTKGLVESLLIREKRGMSQTAQENEPEDIRQTITKAVFQDPTEQIHKRANEILSCYYHDIMEKIKDLEDNLEKVRYHKDKILYTPYKDMQSSVTGYHTIYQIACRDALNEVMPNRQTITYNNLQTANNKLDMAQLKFNFYKRIGSFVDHLRPRNRALVAPDPVETINDETASANITNPLTPKTTSANITNPSRHKPISVKVTDSSTDKTIPSNAKNVATIIADNEAPSPAMSSDPDISMTPPMSSVYIDNANMANFAHQRNSSTSTIVHFDHNSREIENSPNILSTENNSASVKNDNLAFSKSSPSTSTIDSHGSTQTPITSTQILSVGSNKASMTDAKPLSLGPMVSNDIVNAKINPNDLVIPIHIIPEDVGRKSSSHGNAPH